jgi:membrane-bound lytic murein transglycosylase D
MSLHCPLDRRLSLSGLTAGLAALLTLAGCATPTREVAPAAPASVSATPAISAAPVAPRAGAVAPPDIASSATPAAPDQAQRGAPVLPDPRSAEPLRPIQAAAAAALKVASQSAPVDLWDRIRRGFQMPNLDTPQVREREQWYISRPEYIQRMAERSRKYLFHIVEELERRNMPSELALLPFIESAFNPQAVSSAKAAGMWQFIPSTGKFFELKQNAFRDDRRDVLASTKAALDYLQKLHGMFGDWQLALAAYNWGEGSVGRAIAKNQRSGLGQSYLDLNMPAETRLYLPKLQAVKNIVANPQALGANLPLIENHPYFQSVDITRDIDVALAARLAEVGVEDFKSLNPSMNRPVIFAAGIPQILLPWDNAALFQRNLEASAGARLASWTVWNVPSTMKPADAAKRTGMNEAELRAINDIPRGVSIKAGSTLVVPRSDRVDADVASHVADHGQLALVREPLAQRSTIKAGAKDSVANVARRYGLPAARVAEWNHVSAQALFAAGQQVVLFLPTRSIAAKAPALASVRKPSKRATRVAGSARLR